MKTSSLHGRERQKASRLVLTGDFHRSANEFLSPNKPSAICISHVVTDISKAALYTGARRVAFFNLRLCPFLFSTLVSLPPVYGGDGFAQWFVGITDFLTYKYRVRVSFRFASVTFHFVFFAVLFGLKLLKVKRQD